MMRYIDRDKHYRVSSELYAGLINLLLTLPLEFKKTAAVEIGSYIGESANILSLFFQEVVCIDPENDFLVREIFTKNTAGRNVEIITKISDEAHAELYHEGYGLVYIDGVHTYEAVRKDIANYWPKVIPGGYIGGHDYGKGPENAGVMRAVNEVFCEPDFIFVDESWLVKKTPERLKA
jgi:predicted O-methyltransferase YrrM